LCVSDGRFELSHQSRHAAGLIDDAVEELIKRLARLVDVRVDLELRRSGLLNPLAHSVDKSLSRAGRGLLRVGTGQQSLGSVGNAFRGLKHLFRVLLERRLACINEAGSESLEVGTQVRTNLLQHLAERNESLVDVDLKRIEDRPQPFGHDREYFAGRLEHRARIEQDPGEATESSHELIEHAREKLGTAEQRVCDGVGNRRAALAIRARERFHEREELIGNRSHDRCQVAGHLTDDALDGRTHEIESVIHLGNVGDLIFAHDDAEPLGSRGKLFDAGRALLEQRREGRALPTEDLNGSGSPVSRCRQRTDRGRDRLKLLLGPQPANLGKRDADRAERFIERTARVGLADRHAEPRHRRGELLGIDTRELRREPEPLKFFYRHVDPVAQIIQRIERRGNA